jgi:hypothetical protein
MLRTVAFVLVSICLISCDRPAPPDTRALRLRLNQRIHEWVDADRLARDNGFIYAVDVAHLLAYAADAGDRELYLKLRDYIVKHFVVDGPDAFRRGFVQWRIKPGDRPDATGTTEALRVAEGLWRGGERFGRPEDRELARVVLHGYARHEGHDAGVWLIRNYFNLQTGAFATNTFLVDYDPDFVAEVAEATGDEKLAEIAAKSYDLVAKSTAPCGLIYDLVQPEVMTLTPELRQYAFSPNDVLQISNSATVAERVARGRPGVARPVLTFAMQRSGRLNHYYLGRTGEEVMAPGGGDYVTHAPQPVGPETWAVLARLALKLGDRAAAERCIRKLAPRAEGFANQPYAPELYLASEMLMALQAWENAQAGSAGVGARPR